MKINILAFSLLIILGSLMSCQSEKKVDLTSQISSLEDSLYAEKETIQQADKKELAKRLIVLYESYAASPIADSLKVEAMFKAADLATNVTNSYAKAVQLYYHIYTDFPNADRAPASLFLEAMVYQDKIENLDKAKELFEKFLEKYPEDDLADDAAFSIKTLGKTPDQIIQEFQEKEATE